MKTLRIWLLVLLAILLPLRGAVAAALPCEGIGHHTPAPHQHRHQHMHATAAAASADPGFPHHDHAGDSKCNLCASCCSAAPLLLTFSPTVAALEDPSPEFPLAQAPLPTFLSDGQERPPRSI